MASPIRIILCGRSANIAKSVMAGLQPDIEVIHIVLSPSEGVASIPSILQGQTPPNSTDNLGSRNYSKTPAAVVTGGGYDDDAFQQMRNSCAGLPKVPWLRPDTTKPTPPLGPEYGKAMVGRVKECLCALEREGKLADDTVVLF